MYNETEQGFLSYPIQGCLFHEEKVSYCHLLLLHKKIRSLYSEVSVLLLEANKRMKDQGESKTVSFDTVMNDLGIREEELLAAEDVDIE